MKIYGKLDLEKFGQLLNALLHKIPNSTIVNSELTAEAQIGYDVEEKRIVFFDGTVVKKVATLGDISANGAKIIVDENDPSTTTSVFEGDGWFKPSVRLLQIRNGSTWKSTASMTNFIIPNWTANFDYSESSVVIFNSQLWRNETGTINNHASWTIADWTRVGGVTLTKVVATITPSILNSSTVGMITRNNSTYNIEHALGSTSIFVKITNDNKIVYTDIEILDANNIKISFNRDAQTSGKTYVVTIAET